MIIQISNGQVLLRDFCTRKLRKEINKALYSDLEVGMDGNISGFNPRGLDAANDVAMIGMIEKITIGGEDKPVTVETLDEMDSRDVDAIIAKINEITNRTLPNG